MPRIALLTRYNTLGASSRVRVLQYLPTLHAAGIETEFFPLFDNDYIKRLYAGQPTNLQRLRLLWSRILQMPAITRRGRFDMLCIEKELLPYIPYAVEKYLLGNTPYWLDYDDAIFHNYDRSGNPLIRTLLSQKIDRLMARARLITCGNSYLAGRAERAGASWVDILPSTIDFEKYHQAPDPVQQTVSDAHPLRLIWIGSPATSRYLGLVQSALEQVGSRYPLELITIGADAPSFKGVRHRSIVWEADTEAISLAQGNVGIMPLRDTPWEQGKCSFKLIQYMATGLPVIGSAVGMNKDVVIPGQNGLLASTTDEWVQAIETLLRSPEQRTAMGQAGRLAAREHYSIQAVGPRLADILFRAIA